MAANSEVPCRWKKDRNGLKTKMEKKDKQGVEERERLQIRKPIRICIIYRVVLGPGGHTIASKVTKRSTYLEAQTLNSLRIDNKYIR